ncbi:MAG TPA: SufD family Fe-S cluster assembly protein [Acidimicrobiales bacterium]|nr:SufD family Fe-S cluster assembly protein [Acidimicrobiales bacterium]
MKTFPAEESAALGGPAWLADRRREAFERLGAMSPPTEEAEVWRYSPIDRLDLDAYRPVAAPAAGPPPGAALALAEEFGPGPRAIVHNGRIALLERRGLRDAVRFGAASALPSAPSGLGDVVGRDDFFVTLNDSFAPDAIALEVPARVALDQPIVIVHWCDTSTDDGPAPTTLLRGLVSVGEDAEAQVVEVVAGPAEAGRGLVILVGEMVVGDRGRLSYVMVQDLGHDTWHLARLGATVGRDGTLKSFTAGLGGDYDRCRVDAAALGQGSSTQLTTVYLGSGDQVHDVRTLQDHVAPKTTSDLLCKGAVAERSRSIYTGLIRVRNGAARSDAMQTNHNLVLDASAHADSVPNLDIEENDVRCSHASSVGPVDEDQRYYLESRGLSPDRAERLIVLGFFDDIVERAPVASAMDPLRRRIGQRLAGLLGRGGESDE